MAKIKCEKCGATWDNSQNNACPYCGSAGVVEEEKSQENATGGTTIINNFYGNSTQDKPKNSAGEINERGEPANLSEKELKIYYQPRPRFLWVVVICYLVCVSLIGGILENFFAIEKILPFFLVLPVATYIIIVKCLQARWDKLHNQAKSLREKCEKNDKNE